MSNSKFIITRWIRVIEKEKKGKSVLNILFDIKSMQNTKIIKQLVLEKGDGKGPNKPCQFYIAAL